MYRIIIAALLFFPWVLAITIAIGSLRAARRKSVTRIRLEK